MKVIKKTTMSRNVKLSRGFVLSLVRVPVFGACSWWLFELGHLWTVLLGAVCTAIAVNELIKVLSVQVNFTHTTTEAVADEEEMQ